MGLQLNVRTSSFKWLVLYSLNIDITEILTVTESYAKAGNSASRGQRPTGTFSTQSQCQSQHGNPFFSQYDSMNPPAQPQSQVDIKPPYRALNSFDDFKSCATTSVGNVEDALTWAAMSEWTKSNMNTRNEIGGTGFGSCDRTIAVDNTVTSRAESETCLSADAQSGSTANVLPDQKSKSNETELVIRIGMHISDDEERANEQVQKDIQEMNRVREQSVKGEFDGKDGEQKSGKGKRKRQQSEYIYDQVKQEPCSTDPETDTALTDLVTVPSSSYLSSLDCPSAKLFINPYAIFANDIAVDAESTSQISSTPLLTMTSSSSTPSASSSPASGSSSSSGNLLLRASADSVEHVITLERRSSQGLERGKKRQQTKQKGGFRGDACADAEFAIGDEDVEEQPRPTKKTKTKVKEQVSLQSGGNLENGSC